MCTQDIEKKRACIRFNHRTLRPELFLSFQSHWKEKSVYIYMQQRQRRTCFATTQCVNRPSFFCSSLIVQADACAKCPSARPFLLRPKRAGVLTCPNLCKGSVFRFRHRLARRHTRRRTSPLLCSPVGARGGCVRPVSRAARSRVACVRGNVRGLWHRAARVASGGGRARGERGESRWKCHPREWAAPRARMGCRGHPWNGDGGEHDESPEKRRVADAGFPRRRVVDFVLCCWTATEPRKFSYLRVTGAASATARLGEVGWRRRTQMRRVPSCRPLAASRGQ